MLSSLFRYVPNDEAFPTLGDNSDCQKRRYKNCQQKELQQTKSLLLPASPGSSLVPFEMPHCRDAFKGPQWGTTTNCKNNPSAYLPCNWFFQVVARQEMKASRGKKTSGRANSNLVQNKKPEEMHRRPVLILSKLDFRCAPFPTQKHLCLPDLQTPLWIWSTHWFLFPFISFHTYK